MLSQALSHIDGDEPGFLRGGAGSSQGTPQLSLAACPAAESAAAPQPAPDAAAAAAAGAGALDPAERCHTRRRPGATGDLVLLLDCRRPGRGP